MTKRVTGFGLFCGLVALVAACGGSVLSAGDPSPATGGAGASSGGAGAGGAGASSGGADSGGAGAPSAGASSSDRCSSPAVAGPCDGYAPSFWHNPQTGLCEPFVYGGCDGNSNHYATGEDCVKACPGGGSNWGACQKHSDCVLTHADCCAACEPVKETDWVALNGSHLADYTNSEPCASVGACAPCLPVSVLDEQGKYFRPACMAGQCFTLDVRLSPDTACNDDSDCILRSGVNCCPNCQGGFVSVNAHADFCPDGPAPCPRCATVPPPQTLLAVCQNKRCVLEETLK